MSVLCAISGMSPEEPVFSKTGYVFEKRLIEKHIEAEGKCPVTNEELTATDLTPIKANKVVKPRPVTATSIPGMLSMFQNEWDAVMGETYQIKQALDTTRKQLSHALYQHDAACRVIARLIKERDVSKSQVVQLQQQLASIRATGIQAAVKEAEMETGITPEMIQQMTELSKSLSKTRKQKNFPNLTPVAELKQFKLATSNPCHQSTAPGIICVDVHPQDTARVVTGGVDQQVVLFNAKEAKMATKLLGHSKKVCAVRFHPQKDVVLSSSQDTTARVWTCSDASNWQATYTCAHVVRGHKAEVTDVSVHPLGDYFSTCSLDRSWAFNDLNTGRVIRHVKDLPSGYRCMAFHPDGLILGGGTEDKLVNVWDIKDQVIVAKLEGHESEVLSLSFSENGYYLATASKDGAVKLWDLRKPICIQTIKVEENAPVNCVRFDKTGQYLAVGASAVQVYNFESKASLAPTVQFSEHTGAVMGVAFGPNAAMLASVSMDRHLKLFSTP